MIEQRVIFIRGKNSQSIFRPSGLGGASSCTHHEQQNMISLVSVQKVPRRGSGFTPLCPKQHPHDPKIGLNEIHTDISS